MLNLQSDILPVCWSIGPTANPIIQKEIQPKMSDEEP